MATTIVTPSQIHTTLLVGQGPAGAAPSGAGNAFVTIAVAGQSNVVADSSTDTLTLVAGAGMVITTTAGSDTITFTANPDLSSYAQLTNNSQDIVAGSISLNDLVTASDVVLQVSDGVLQVGATPVNPNATHTGEVTGSGALTVNKTAITGKTLVSAAVGDHVLVADASDSDNLKRVTVQTIVDLAGSGGYTNLTQFVGQTAWRVFYSNTDGDVTELALGTSGQYLKSNGASSAPTWDVPGGSGDVSKVGTPVDNQVGVWTGSGTIEGTTGLTYDGSNFQLTGDIGSTGTRITKGWFTDLQVTNAIAGSVTGNAATVTTNANLTGHITSTGNTAVLGSFTKAQLDTAISDGKVVYVGDALNGTIGATTPAAGTFTTIVAGSATSLLLGTAGSAVGSVGFRNATSGTITVSPPTGALGTVALTLPGTAGTLLVSSGPLGTPSSGTLSNCTGLPISTGVSGLGTGVATFLATPSSANLATAVTDETGSGALVFATSPTLTTPTLGSGSYTNLRSSEVSSTPSGTTQTITLGNGNLQTLSLASTTGNPTVDFVMPSSSAAGSIVLLQHGTTPRDVTWTATGGGTILWAGTQPTWASDAASSYRVIAWRYDGTRLFLSPTDVFTANS
jgi:hypothetical protein